MKRAVVLLSGGVDSTTTLAIARDEGYETCAMTFDYGQRHRVELAAARRVAEAFHIKKHLVIDVNFRGIGGSALTSDMEVPKKRTEARKRGSSIPVTYVPARNTIFLSFALAWAETLKAADIFIGANAVDYSGYPDCRPQFIRAFEAMANLATKVSVEGRLRFSIRTPLIDLSKADIIRRGNSLGVDYSLTWSCYDPQRVNIQSQESGVRSCVDGSRAIPGISGFVPCTQCDSCILRAKGFREAGIKDPLIKNQ